METNVEKETLGTVDRDEFTARELRRARGNAEARFSVLVHLVAYVCINTLLAFINMLIFAGHWWVLWPVFGWGIGLLIHAVAAFFVPSIARVRQRLYRQELDRLRGRA